MFFIKPLNNLRQPNKPNLLGLNFKKSNSDDMEVTAILQRQIESFRLLPIWTRGKSHN